MKDTDEVFSSEAINSIGQLSLSHPKISTPCLKTLIRLCQPSNTKSHSQSKLITSQAISVLKSLLIAPGMNVSGSGLTRAKVIRVLLADVMKEGGVEGEAVDGDAKSVVWWLVGQFAQEEGLGESAGIDAVRIGANTFAQEVRPSSLMSSDLSLLTYVSVTSLLWLNFSY